MKDEESPSTIQGYVAMERGKPLKLHSFKAPKLGENDVRVSVTHCGVCHTDISAIDDYYGITTYPFVPGHEIVGYVSEMGRAVAGLKEGDRVGVGWQGRSCMKCEWCLKGEEQLCMDIVKSATWDPYGGFSSSIIADSRFAYQLPQAMRPEVAAVLLCAGISVYSPLRNYAKGSALKIGVVGVGGLGHIALQFARALGCEVTAISSSPKKKEEALALGADHFIVSNDRDSLRRVEFEFDLLLCTSSGGVSWELLLETLKKKGRMVLVGFPNIALKPVDLVAHELSITGSFLGNRAIMKEVLEFAQAQGITPKVELMPMSQVNGALQRVKENKARYRIVL
ncbi:MAG: NAD(P)-dependent alcohol dehydrogenase, partial [candidate division WOR-3 bacterium]|nr:NAD(P)-dependent alcohol dehydrogenase [candidate division WOR-3 bacterium]